jgi:hypothetical protein
MSVRRRAGRPARAPLALGLLLTFMAARATAQIGQFTTQSLFFNQASSAHRGNYIEADAGAIYNDNVDLRPGGPGDTLLTIGLLADTEHFGQHLDYRLDSDLSLVKYLQGDFKTQPFG